jgi:uncharacterized OB-fold protein
MGTDKQPQRIRVHCPKHQTVFDVENKPHIVCEIQEHTLSSNFPNGEFWEYCCDCQTFLKSEYGNGGTAKDNCLNCERKVISRYVCQNCKIISYDSNEDTKGKVRHISPQKGIEPACPGCHKVNTTLKIFQHDCSDIGKVILTYREKCPFCKKQTGPALSGAVKKEEISASPFISSSESPKLATHCSNCGMAYAKDATFCVGCGMKYKAQQGLSDSYGKAIPPPPPIPGAVSSDSSEVTINFTPPATKSTDISPSKNKQLPIFIGVGCIVLLFVIIGVVSFSKESSSLTNSSENSSNDSELSDLSNPSNSNSSFEYSSNSSDDSSEDSSSLPYSFERTYLGKIGGRSFSMTLKRDGNELTGTASTIKTDTVSGTIKDSGEFTMDGFENGNNLTGLYKGAIKTNGSVEGTWTTPSGNKPTSFYLSEQ